MLLDPENFSVGHVERADVCILGSGPAGLTIARELAETGVSVLLVEAGGWDWEGASQDLFTGSWVGEHCYDLDIARLRYFGGTSGHWEGFCRPLDDHDFEERAGYPPNSWPIAIDDLNPYLTRASEILEVPDTYPSRDLGGGLEQVTFRQSAPVRFGDTHRDYVTSSQTIRIALNSAAVDMTPEDGQITSVTLQTANGGPAWRAEAQYFVLCTGGIENARLLLWFNEQNNRQLIANHDLIGRQWMEHPYVTVGEAVLWADGVDLLDDTRAYFKLSGSLQRELGVLNNAFGLHTNSYGSSELKNLIADLMCVAPGLGQRVMNLRDRDLLCGARVLTLAEQAPQPDNRIALGTGVDSLGIPMVEMHWRRTDLDRRSIAESTLAYGELMAEADIGRVRVSDWVTDESLPMPNTPPLGGWHHLGGTRMSTSPDDGIVNSDLRVHDLDNLYIGGSSVFPSGGCSNPTLTIVQMALRLSEHLHGRMRNL